jgi:hypothetical protein
MNTLMERARTLQANKFFLGGPPELFETAGRKSLILLLSEGLVPNSRVLDIGCGCLRIGYWLIHFLDQGCYFGIEPNSRLLNAGLAHVLEPGLVDSKQPKFNHNAEFDFRPFGETFDFFLARSIWTHAAKNQIQMMLDGFLATADSGGQFFTSYYRTSPQKPDYKGTKWLGRSHESDEAGVVAHSLEWIQTECASRGLTAVEIGEKAAQFGNQTWLRIRRKTN